jgi:hypothetical protein
VDGRFAAPIGAAGVNEGILDSGENMAITKRQSVDRKSSFEQKPWEDAVLRDVYAERDAYAAEHGYDLNRIFADLKDRESRSSLRHRPTQDTASIPI